MIALGLLRVSSEAQAKEGFSLYDQERDIRHHCAARGYPILEILSDDGVSGRIEDRPAILRALHLAEAKAFQVLVLHRVDRAGRANRVIQSLIGRFRDLGIRVEFLDAGNADTKEGRLLINMLGGMAEYAYDELREKTMNARRTKAQLRKVNPTGTPMFGYRVVSMAASAVLDEFTGRDGEMLLVPEEAAVVRRMGELLLDGGSLTSVARTLNAEGVRSRKGNPWGPKAVKDILRNPAYSGVWYWGRNKCRKVEGTNRVRVEPRPSSEWEAIPVPAIFDAPTWNALQERLDQLAAHGAGRPSTLWLLRGAVFCGICRRQDGKPLSCCGRRCGRNKERKGYRKREYVCSSRSNSAREWCGVSGPAITLEREAWTQVLHVLQPGVLAGLAAERARERLKAAGDVGSRLRQVRKELRDMDAREHELVTLRLEGYSREVLAGRLGAVHQRRAALELERKGLEDVQARQVTPEAAARAAESYAAEIRERLVEIEADPEQKQRVIQQLIRITLLKRRRYMEVRTEII